MSRSSLLRAHIEDTLELIADRDAQLRYQAQTPYVEVSTEIFLQWEDWYRPEDEAFAQAFDDEHAATLRVFHQVFTTVRDTMMTQGLPPIEQFVQTTAWKRYSGAARAALGLLRTAAALQAA